VNEFDKIEIELLDFLQEHPDLFEELKTSTMSEMERQNSLRKRFTSDQARALLALHDVRQRAATKFSRADEMWFHRTGMEQSTSEAVARHKAKRFQNGAVSEVVDLCSGIGMDSIALAENGLTVTAVDQSELSAEYLKRNAAVYGVADQITTCIADVNEFDVVEKIIHIDPDRRAGRQRAIRLEDYTPPLEYLQRLTEKSPGGAIKLSPASNFGGKFLGCEVELISLHGECKEATIWYGSLRSESDFTVTILPTGFTVTGDPWLARAPITPLGSYIYDPDPALVRAGLIDVYCEQAGLSRLDDAEEYLTSDEPVSSPAVACFEVLADLPNNDKAVRKYLRGQSFGQMEIKCRHVPVNADQYRKKLPLNGTDPGVLIIARVQGKTRTILAKRIAQP